MQSSFVSSQSYLIDPATNDAPLEFNVNRNRSLASSTLSPESPSSTNVNGSTNLSSSTAADRSRTFKNNNQRPLRDSRPFTTTSRPPANDSRISSTMPEKIWDIPPHEQQIIGTNGNFQTFPGLSTLGAGSRTLLSNPSLAATTPWQTFTMMSNDPFGMMSMANIGQFGLMGDPTSMGMMMTATGGPPMKELLRFSKCTLYPPKPNMPLPTTRERPPGCKTVFVGRLPENVTEEIIREVFQRCGEIATIRMSKKNFCHIRFVDPASVDNAIYLSGYQMKIGDNDDEGNASRLHVDYAQARDDQYDYERQQRALERELRHRQRLEQDIMRPPSPPPVPHYSDYEATSLIERIRKDDTFPQALGVLVLWLERGMCNKKNAPQFYSMIQFTNSHVRRLVNEKVEYEEKLERAKELLKQKLSCIILQFSQIEKVFTASSHKKVWDHFSKAQRKNIELWRKQTEEIKNAHLEEILMEREEDEMDVSDQEDTPESGPSVVKKQKLEETKTGKDTTGEAILREENDSLRCQLEAYRNEVEVLKSELHQGDPAGGSQQVGALRQTVQTLQQQLMMMSQQRAKDIDELVKMRNRLKALQDKKNSAPKAPPKEMSERDKPPPKAPPKEECEKDKPSPKEVLSLSTIENKEDKDKEKVEPSNENGNEKMSKEDKNQGEEDEDKKEGGVANMDCEEDRPESTEPDKQDALSTRSESSENLELTSTSALLSIPGKDALLIGILSTFLHVHPRGATLDALWAFAQQVDPLIVPHDIETVLTAYPSVFSCNIVGVGTSQERRWMFIGLNLPS